MKDFCVLGSGIAGSAIANLLSKKYSASEVVNRAKGDAEATVELFRRLSFDHGLQYLSPVSNDFKKFIIDLKRKKILKEWSGQHLDLTFKRKKNLIKYIGSKGNNDICKYLIKNIKVNTKGMVTNIEFNGEKAAISLNNKDQVFFKYLILEKIILLVKSSSIKVYKKRDFKFKGKYGSKYHNNSCIQKLQKIRCESFIIEKYSEIKKEIVESDRFESNQKPCESSQYESIFKKNHQFI